MPKRILQGKVVSNSRDKTVTVVVTRRVRSGFIGKIVTKTKKYHAHDESNKVNVGDVVSIQECRPYSKTKTWEVISQA